MNSFFVVFSGVPYLAFMASISNVITNVRLFKSKWIAMIAFYAVVNVGFASAASLIYGDTVEGFETLPRASMQIIAASLGSLPYKQMFVTSPSLTLVFILAYQFIIYTVFVRSFLLIFMASCDEYTSIFEKSKSSTAGIIDKSLKRIARVFSSGTNIVFKRISLGIKYIRELLSSENAIQDLNMHASGDELVAVKVCQKVRSLANQFDRDIIDLTLSEGRRFAPNLTFQNLLTEVQQKSNFHKKDEYLRRKETQLREEPQAHTASTWTENFLQRIQLTHSDFADRLRKSVINRSAHYQVFYFMSEEILNAVGTFLVSEGFEAGAIPSQLQEMAYERNGQAFTVAKNIRSSTIELRAGSRQPASLRELEVVPIIQNSQQDPDQQPGGSSENSPDLFGNPNEGFQSEFKISDLERGASLVTEKFVKTKTQISSELVSQSRLWMLSIMAATAAAVKKASKLVRGDTRSSLNSPTKRSVSVVSALDKLFQPLKTTTVSDILKNMTFEALIPLRRFWLNLLPDIKQEIWCAEGPEQLSLSCRFLILAALGYSVTVDSFERMKGSEGDTDRPQREAKHKENFNGKKLKKSRSKVRTNTIQGLIEFTNLQELAEFICREERLGSRGAAAVAEKHRMTSTETLPEELKYEFMLQLPNSTRQRWKHMIYSPLQPTATTNKASSTMGRNQDFKILKEDQEVIIPEALYIIQRKPEFWLRLGSLSTDVLARFSYLACKNVSSPSDI